MVGLALTGLAYGSGGVLNIAVDTAIDLPQAVSGDWDDNNSANAGIKLHTQPGLRGPIPSCILVTAAREHDVGWLDGLLSEPGAFHVLDRGYMDFARLARITGAAASFVTRAKSNLRFSRQFPMPVDRSTGLRSDQAGRPTLPGARRDFPHMLRLVRYFDETSGRCFVFLTNNLTIPAPSGALPCKSRWQVEIFFKWVKGHLRVKHYYGNSANAVRTQIWISVCTYVMIAILHKQLGLPGTLHRTLQLLSVHPFAKVPLAELLMETDPGNPTNPNPNQLSLWDL